MSDCSCSIRHEIDEIKGKVENHQRDMNIVNIKLAKLDGVPDSIKRLFEMERSMSENLAETEKRIIEANNLSNARFDKRFEEVYKKDAERSEATISMMRKQVIGLISGIILSIVIWLIGAVLNNVFLLNQ